MELGALVAKAKFLAILVLAGSKSTEVLSSFGDGLHNIIFVRSGLLQRNDGILTPPKRPRTTTFKVSYVSSFGIKTAFKHTPSKVFVTVFNIKINLVGDFWALGSIY